MSDVEGDMLKELLTFDALSAAEEQTGKSYKEDEQTHALGLALFLNANKVKRETLKARNDTYYDMPFADALRILDDLGFAPIIQITFERTRGDLTMLDVQALYWSTEGYLVSIESYDDCESVNSFNLYGNLFLGTTDEEEFSPSLPGVSCHFNLNAYDNEGRRIQVFQKDVRDGLRHFLDHVQDYGFPLRLWVEPYWPEFWLPYIEDFHGSPYERIQGGASFDEVHLTRGALVRELIAALPPYVVLATALEAWDG